MIQKVMNNCNLNEEDAVREIKSANSSLMAGEVSLYDIEDYCLGLGIDEEDLLSNPEMLLL